MDEDLTIQVAQPIYQSESTGVYYQDADLKTQLEIVRDFQPNTDASTSGTGCSTSVTCEPSAAETNMTDEKIKMHDIWIKEDTMFLINAMREYVSDENNEKPKTLLELENKIRRGRGNKKAIWNDISEKLSTAFKKHYDTKRVARKWQTLIDALKEALLNNNSTGKSPSKFAYLSEMQDLLGCKHDISFVVTGTEKSTTVHRPDELKGVDVKSQNNTAESETLSTNSTSAAHSNCTMNSQSRKRKRRDQSDEALIKYMRESDDVFQEQQNKVVEEMTQFRSTFTNMFEKLLDKM